MNREFYSLVSRFTFRSERATSELVRLVAILDRDESQILDQQGTPLSSKLIETAQTKLDNFFSQQAIVYDYGPLILKLKLLHQMLLQPLPRIGEITTSELAPYEEQPDEVLRLLNQVQEIILQLRKRPL